MKGNLSLVRPNLLTCTLFVKKCRVSVGYNDKKSLMRYFFSVTFWIIMLFT